MKRLSAEPTGRSASVGQLTDAPAHDEFELSVFGAGVGEALALHVGGGHWGLVDSLREPVSTEPVGLRYLRQLGASPEDVRFVLATHWHDDHIEGLGEIVELCSEAMFGCSAGYTGQEFMAVLLEYPPSLKTAGVREIRRCFQLIEDKAERGSPRPTPKRVIEHQNVWWSANDDVVVHALAPTSGALSRSEQDIMATLLPNAQRRRSIGRIKPNQASIVVNVRMPGDAVLLGGDLEERGSAGTGWSAVVERFPSNLPRGTVFKVPHHGSAGAHFAGQWTTLLYEEPRPIAAVTSYAPSNLPREGDLRRICDLAGSVYLCGTAPAPPVALSGPERRRVSADGVRLSPTKGVGHVRLRRKFDGETANWSVAVTGHAERVTKAMVSRPQAPTAPRRRRRRR
jgi:hypothetical protein